MKKKPSRLLERLDAEIASAATPLDADCKRAERAGYRAREGEIDEARDVLKTLHQRYDSRPHVAISAWLSLAEGLLSHFSDMGAPAHDKIKRAYALSGAAGMTSLRALSAAWLAHMEYTKLQMNLVLRYADEALCLASDKNHSTHSRVGLVLAEAWHLSDRPEKALRWYKHSRYHSSQEGDDVTMSAITHNMAWLRMSGLRQKILNGQPNSDEASRAIFSAEINRQFDVMLGGSSLDILQPILQAQILSLQGKSDDALAIYEKYLPKLNLSGASRFRSNLIADQAWCKAKVGRLSEAQCDAEEAILSLISEPQLDDKAAAHSRLADVFEKLSELELSAEHRAQANIEWKKYFDFQRKTIELLEKSGK